MSKYKVGDVVIAPMAYMDKKTGYYTSQPRRFVVVKVEEDAENDESENLTVSSTGQLHQSENHPGIIIKCNSKTGVEMLLEMDTFIYCDYTIKFSDKDIIRKKGYCREIDQILKIVVL